MDETLALYLQTHLDAVLTIHNDSENVVVELTDGGEMVFRAGAPIGEPGVYDHAVEAAEAIVALMAALTSTIANDAFGESPRGS